MGRPDPSAALRAPGRGASAATKAAWDFARIEEFWELFRPLTPYGKEAKDGREVFADGKVLAAMYDRTEAWLAFVERVTTGGDASVLDRVSYHLGRIPRLPPVAESEAGMGPGLPFELTEVFLVKKFLANYRALRGLLDKSARDAFGLIFASDELSVRLGLGGSDAETFYIADAYDPRLREVRSRIACLDARIAEFKRATREQARGLSGLDFEDRDFLIVPVNASPSSAGACDAEGASLFIVEPFDGGNHVVRLSSPPEQLALELEREKLLSEEGALENEVLGELSGSIRAEIPHLAAYVAALRELDLARGRAELVRDHGLSRPILSDAEDPDLELRCGRFIPLEADCRDTGLRYTPLDLGLETRAAIVFGSNMGGKTVVLETIVFLQILAQAGFHVPAKKFSSGVYPLIHYVGESRDGEWISARRDPPGQKNPEAPSEPAAGGLSGFGFEIRSFVEAWLASSRGALIAFDEFARTTSSREAEAILSSVLEALVERPGLRSLFSTHFHGVERIAGVRYLRMKGLDREQANAAFSAQEPLPALLRRVNEMMDYRVVEEETFGSESDAIAIAALLGLDQKIAQRAKDIYRQQLSKE